MTEIGGIQRGDKGIEKPVNGASLGPIGDHSPGIPSGRSLAPQPTEKGIEGLEVGEKRRTSVLSPKVQVFTPPHVETRRVTFLPGPVSRVRFANSQCGMVGDGSKLDIDSEYTVYEVHIDAASFVDGLSGRSVSALQDFIKNPGSSTAREMFQRTLPDETLPPAEHTTEKYKARPQAATVIENCAIGVVGDNNEAMVEADYSAATGVLELAQVLRNEDAAATALARYLADTEDDAAQHEFDRCVVQAINPEILRSLLDNATFHSDRPATSHIFRGFHADGVIAGTVGAGTKARSTITVEAHEVSLDGITAFAGIAVVEQDPEADQDDFSIFYVEPAVEAAGFRRREQEQRDMDAAAARRTLQIVLEEDRRRRIREMEREEPEL